MRLLFSADGSSGDLIPMVLMAREFKQAGYDVCVCGSTEFEGMAVDFDVPYEAYPHSYSDIYLDNQKTGYIHNIRENIRHRERLFKGEFELLSKIAPDYDVLFNFLGEILVPSFAEAFNMANVKLFTFPVIPSERYGPPMGLPFVTENKWINRLEWAAAVFSAKYLFSYNKTIDRMRGELGLAPSRNLLAENAQCDHMMIGLYEELVPPCPSWSSIDYSYIGPCIPSQPAVLSDSLEEFLSQGSAPVYIGFGSMRHQNSDMLTRTLVEAARSAGVRTVLAQAGSTIGAEVEEADDVYVLREYPIPHHKLFPRCLAAVHHGSWITTHLAARAGVPQLVLPQASDQYMWGEIIYKKELGPKWVDMNNLSQRKLRTALERLVTREAFARHASDFAERVEGIDGAKNAVESFERVKSKLKR